MGGHTSVATQNFAARVYYSSLVPKARQDIDLDKDTVWLIFSDIKRISIYSETYIISPQKSFKKSPVLVKARSVKHQAHSVEHSVNKVKKRTLVQKISP